MTGKELTFERYPEDSLFISRLKTNLAARLNADADFIDAARNANESLFLMVSTAIAKAQDHNAEELFERAVTDLIATVPRYSWVKNIHTGERDFEIEVDLLTRCARLYDVTNGESVPR